MTKRLFPSSSSRQTAPSHMAQQMGLRPPASAGGFSRHAAPSLFRTSTAYHGRHPQNCSSSFPTAAAITAIRLWQCGGSQFQMTLSRAFTTANGATYTVVRAYEGNVNVEAGGIGTYCFAQSNRASLP